MKESQKPATEPLTPATISTAVGAEIEDPERGSIHLCHGYDLYNDLLGRYSWLELTILHLKGELPEKKELQALDLLFSCVINPGPKNHATQAAMTAAVTHTPVGNSLLTGLAVLEGRYHGALAVEEAMLLLNELAEKKRPLDQQSLNETLGKYPDLPGFSELNGTKVKRMELMLQQIESCSDKSVSRHIQTARQLASLKQVQLSPVGLFAAGLADLGYTPRQGHGLYLLAAAPGILAHLLEQMEGSWRSYPFGSPLDYKGPKDKELTPEQCCYQREK